MDFKAVLRNIKKRGIKGTLELRRKRKADEEAARQCEEELRARKAWLQGVQDKVDEQFPAQEHGSSAHIDALRDAVREGITAKITQSEKPKTVRAVITKTMLPKLYEDEAKHAVEHKVILMERGAKLSGSFTCLKEYLEEKTDYDVHIHVLGARVIPDEEYWANVMAYIADCATAEAIFNCTANDYMGYLTLRPETTYIQLWHGCGILKKVGLSTIGYSFGKSAKGHKEYPLNTNYTYVTLASPEQEWIYEEAMGLDASTGVLVSTGISRTDVFFDEAYLAKARKKLLKLVPQAAEKKVILYAPTFRGEVAQAQGPDELDLHKMARELGDEYVLVIKHHQSVKETPKIPEDLEGTFVYDLTRGNGISINQLMATADLCISDYSSIIFEYSLFERPMIFFTYDIEDYNDERGLYYKLEDILPGPLVYNTDEVIAAVKSFEGGANLEKIKEFRQRFMANCDGHSTERIVNLIGTKPQPRGE